MKLVDLDEAVRWFYPVLTSSRRRANNPTYFLPWVGIHPVTLTYFSVMTEPYSETLMQNLQESSAEEKAGFP
jgi:hypothetical protein